MLKIPQWTANIRHSIPTYEADEQVKKQKGHFLERRLVT